MISDNVLDAALDYIDDNVDIMYVCSNEPTTFVEASATYKLGYKSTPTIGVPEAGTTGRKVVVSAVTDGVIDGTGTVNYIALADSVAEELIYVLAVDNPRLIDAESVFTTTAFDIEVA